MIPIAFPGHTKVLGAPVGWDEAKHGPCGGLPVHTDGTTCVSEWRATWRERLHFLLSGRMRLYVVSGSTQPPVMLDVGPVRWTTS